MTQRDDLGLHCGMASKPQKQRIEQLWFLKTLPMPVLAKSKRRNLCSKSPPSGATDDFGLLSSAINPSVHASKLASMA
jgi:hypothetical protein